MKYHAPKHVCWDITRKCNDSCQFCYRVIDRADLPPGEHFLIANKLIIAGVKKVSIVGGEPLLLPHLAEVLGMLQEGGITTSLITNGRILEDRIHEIAFNVDWITLPLDGASTLDQAAMSRYHGHFDRVMSVIPLIRERNIKLKVNTVISRVNAQKMDCIARLMVRIVPDRWKIFQFLPIRGIAKRNESLFEISSSDFRSAVGRAVDQVEPKGVSISVADWSYMEGNYFSISPDGTVRTTVNQTDVVVGNLLSQTVEQIWSSIHFNQEKHWLLRENLPIQFYSRKDGQNLRMSRLARHTDAVQAVSES